MVLQQRIVHIYKKTTGGPWKKVSMRTSKVVADFSNCTNFNVAFCTFPPLSVAKSIVPYWGISLHNRTMA